MSSHNKRLQTDAQRSRVPLKRGVMFEKANMRKISIIFVLLVIFFCVTTLSPVNAQDDRWEEWPKVDGATAKSGPDEFYIFYDPQNQDQIMD